MNKISLYSIHRLVFTSEFFYVCLNFATENNSLARQTLFKKWYRRVLLKPLITRTLLLIGGLKFAILFGADSVLLMLLSLIKSLVCALYFKNFISSNNLMSGKFYNFRKFIGFLLRLVSKLIVIDLNSSSYAKFISHRRVLHMIVIWISIQSHMKDGHARWVYFRFQSRMKTS